MANSFNIESLNAPELRSMPQTQQEWFEYNRFLFADILEPIVAGLQDNGRITEANYLPPVNSTNVGSAQSLLPLSAEDAGSDVTITVAAHTLQVGSTLVSYGSGVITGLDYETIYYVFVDDPDLSGGTVTYSATDDPQVLTSIADRVRIGAILTPAVAGSPTTGGGGGGGGVGFEPGGGGVMP